MKNHFTAIIILFSFQFSFAQKHDSCTMKIQMLNLSEQLTKNDEILLLIYNAPIDSLESAEVIKKRLTFSEKNSYSKFRIKDMFGSGSVSVFMFELDEDLNAIQLDAIVRRHSQEIIALFRKRNYTELEQLIGDDDLLGFHSSDNVEDHLNFTISGFYKLDKYEYRFGFRR